MPRPKKPGSGEPKTRSRHGCWPCKTRKIKCGEEKPSCQNCERNGEKCDYTIRLNWDGRNKKGGGLGDNMLDTTSFATGNGNTSSKTKIEPPQSSPGRVNFYAPTQSPPIFAGSPGHQGSPSNGNVVDGFSIRDQSNGSAFGSSDGLTSAKDLSSMPFKRLREHSEGSYPSPAESTSDSPTSVSAPSLRFAQVGLSNPTSNPDMRPPFPSQNPPIQFFNRENASELSLTLDQRSKKMRFNGNGDTSDPYNMSSQTLQTNNYSPVPNFTSNSRPGSVPQHSPYNSSFSSPTRFPPTPAFSEEQQRAFARPSSHSSIETHGDRRVSVQSLLSEASPVDSANDIPFPGRLSVTSTASSEKMPYGIDRGHADRDIPNNDDKNALSDRTPTLSTVGLGDGESDPGLEDGHSEFGFGLDANNDTEEFAPYYSKPIRVCISRSLEPLPAELRENPMNLLYFHHFLDHTARILVPHDCSENPFKSILPKMALEDSTLLHLLLSYSACHRSRLLNHPEPVNRIAHWMHGVFPSLASALNPGNTVSDSNLAAAIMLASLEIIAPKSFEVEIPWQKHLNIARQMIVQRGQGRPVHRRETVAYFLTRWFAYLDVLGSLSGRKNDKPLFHGDYWATGSQDDETAGYQIDCLLGFTSRCVSILAKIAELARQCDAERISPETGHVNTDWKPSESIMNDAHRHKIALEEARMHRYHGCPHRRNTSSSAQATRDSVSYAVELVTTNDAFHWAGLIHLHRRVLGKHSEDPEVQMYVREIVTALYKIRKGGAAESCLLFPMFTAGCEAKEKSQQEVIMDRLKSVESSGMFQVKQARTLMEKVWETGRSWESFGGEFIG